MVLRSTKLGYTLGIKRDRDIISPRERQKASPFKGRRIRMAGEKRVDIFTAERDYLRAPTARGDFLPNRFRVSVPAPNLEISDG